MKKLKEKWLSFSRKKKIWIGVGAFVFVLGWFLLIMWWTVWSWDYVYYESRTTNYGSCDMVAVTIQGDIASYRAPYEEDEDIASAEDIIFTLEEVDKENFKVVMLDITSWGGSPAPSKEIADFVAQMKTPVVASIREAGMSGAYYIASQADEIFASPFSDIGSIGVTMSYLDDARLNEKAGYTWNSLSTGVFKDAGSMEKPLTKEERALFERDLKIMHDVFVEDVARARGIPLEDMKKIADGSSVLAGQAVELKLIDGVKHQWEVIKYIQEKYKVGNDICWE